MKKLVSVFLSVLMVTSLFLPASAIKAPCAHTNVTVYVKDKVKETCTKETYNFEKFCNDCGIKLEGGRMAFQKNPPTHIYAWVSIGCTGSQHTYERRCTKCGDATESMTVKCNGNCIEFQSLEGLA